MGMVFGIGRKDARDEEDLDEPRRVPYRLASYEHDHEGKRFRSSRVVYSFWSASKYVFILSIMLWWLPMFGQMIAGYVGGRRAGGPWKGVFAAIIPVVSLYMLMTGFESGLLPSHLLGLAISPAAIGASIDSNSIPLIAPYLQFSKEYVGSFVSSLAGASPYGINTYVLTVAFAYVGGVLAAQNRREIEFNSGSVMSNTTVLVADSDQYAPQVDPRTEQPNGFAARIGSFFHHDAGPVAASGGYLSHRRRDSWSRATPMVYADARGEIDDEGYMLPPPNAGSRHNHRGHTHHHARKDDQWGKQRRRGRPNFNAKVRFNYPQFKTQDGGNEQPVVRQVTTRRLKQPQRLYVSPDPRSIKRAEKIIDREWNRSRYHAFNDRPNRVHVDDVESDEAEVAVQSHKEHHAAAPRSWESI